MNSGLSSKRKMSAERQDQNGYYGDIVDFYDFCSNDCDMQEDGHVVKPGNAPSASSSVQRKSLIRENQITLRDEANIMDQNQPDYCDLNESSSKSGSINSPNAGVYGESNGQGPAKRITYVDDQHDDHEDVISSLPPTPPSSNSTRSASRKKNVFDEGSSPKSENELNFPERDVSPQSKIAQLEHDVEHLSDKLLSEINKRAIVERQLDKMNEEVEELSEQLFLEANEMVAKESKRKHELEMENKKLKHQLSEKSTSFTSLMGGYIKSTTKVRGPEISSRALMEEMADSRLYDQFIDYLRQIYFLRPDSSYECGAMVSSQILARLVSPVTEKVDSLADLSIKDAVHKNSSRRKEQNAFIHNCIGQFISPALHWQPKTIRFISQLDRNADADNDEDVKRPEHSSKNSCSSKIVSNRWTYNNTSLISKFNDLHASLSLSSGNLVAEGWIEDILFGNLKLGLYEAGNLEAEKWYCEACLKIHAPLESTSSSRKVYYLHWKPRSATDSEPHTNYNQAESVVNESSSSVSNIISIVRSLSGSLSPDSINHQESLGEKLKSLRDAGFRNYRLDLWCYQRIESVVNLVRYLKTIVEKVLSEELKLESLLDVNCKTENGKEYDDFGIDKKDLNSKTEPSQSQSNLQQFNIFKLDAASTSQRNDHENNQQSEDLDLIKDTFFQCLLLIDKTIWSRLGFPDISHYRFY